MSTNGNRHQPRSGLGGYSTADMDKAFLRTQRSDLPSILARLITLAFVYVVMARGIVVHGVGAGYLLVPLAFEWLFALWLGWILARFVVDCPRFRKAGGRIMVPVGWTLVIGLVTAAVLKWNGATTGFSEPLAKAWSEGLETVISSGLIWALVAETVGLLAGTVFEIQRWRRTGGTFVWTSVTSLGLRFAMIILVYFVGMFGMVMLAESLGDWFFGEPRRIAWLVFSMLLVIDLGAVVLGAFIHRDVAREAAERGSG